MRDFYLKPFLKLAFTEEKLLELKTPLYEFADNEDYWKRTRKSHLDFKQKIEFAVSDPAFF